MSVGSTTSRTLFVIECLDEWITHPAITPGFNHFFMAVEAGLTELDESHLHLAINHPDEHLLMTISLRQI